MNKLKVLSVIVVTGLISSPFQNCSQVNFNEGEQVLASQGVAEIAPTCQLNSTLTRIPTKVILVVDQSSSNNLPTTSTEISTDPGRVFRYSALSRLTQRNLPSPLLQYSMISFWSDQRTRIQDWTKGFLSQPDELEASLTRFASYTRGCRSLGSNHPDYLLSDCGGTPYADAAQAAYDQVDANDEFRYVVIFVSDGVPSASSVDAAQAAREATLATIQRTIDKKPGKVFVNTVHYYREVANPNAIDFIKQIATIGRGKSVAVESSSSIDLGQELTITEENCQP